MTVCRSSSQLCFESALQLCFESALATGDQMHNAHIVLPAAGLNDRGAVRVRHRGCWWRPTSCSPRPHNICVTRQSLDLEKLLDSSTGRRKGIPANNKCEPCNWKHELWRHPGRVLPRFSKSHRNDRDHQLRAARACACSTSLIMGGA